MSQPTATGLHPEGRLDEILRVDYAGEYGAVAIYSGQLAVFERRGGHDRIIGKLREMRDQEQVHLDAFNKLIRSHRARPTALAPLWNVAGFALGAATALLGEKAAHACTEAVESVIERHYADQIAELDRAGQTELGQQLSVFRDEEIEHRDLAESEGARQAPAYPLLSAAIQLGCRIAIRISEKV